jgi:tetratricopeptide (TPR) repeat protein
VFLERAVTIAPSPTALVTLFSILVDSGDLATAERYLRQAQQIAPDNLWVQYDFARLADLRGNRSDAIQRLEAIIRQDPSFGPAREGLEQLR